MVLGVGLAMGMYITTQIVESIDKNIRRKKFIKNMNKYKNNKNKIH